MYWRRRLTRLELALYSAVAGLAMAIFLDRALYYMELAERTAVEVTIANVNSALAVRSARALLAGRPADTALNPFDVVGAPPNYLGALAEPDFESMERRAWLFDRKRNEVIYLPRHTRALRTAEPGRTVRFKQVSQDGVSKLVPTNKWDWNQR